MSHPIDGTAQLKVPAENGVEKEDMKIEWESDHLSA
jgi:hypothetical protein